MSWSKALGGAVFLRVAQRSTEGGRRFPFGTSPRPSELGTPITDVHAPLGFLLCRIWLLSRMRQLAFIVFIHKLPLASLTTHHGPATMSTVPPYPHELNSPQQSSRPKTFSTPSTSNVLQALGCSPEAVRALGFPETSIHICTK